MGQPGREFLDPVVEGILALFEIDVPRRQMWGGTLAELRRVLAADYEGPVAQYVAAGELPVDELLRCAAVHFPAINREPLEYPGTLARARDRERGLGVAVTLSPFGRPGHPLRGFYHHVEDRRPLIWLNCQHTATAVGATLAHELGHYFWEQVADAGTDEPKALHHDGFAAHLADPRELFADVFAALGGYPQPVARRLFARSAWWGPQGGRAAAASATVARVEKHVHRYYPGNLGPQGGLTPRLRLYYLGSLIHFSKLRAAILRVTGR
jgi:hypothetical protein